VSTARGCESRSWLRRTTRPRLVAAQIEPSNAGRHAPHGDNLLGMLAKAAVASTPRGALSFMLLFACAARSTSASADDNDQHRPPMPEPLFNETMTDIDSTDAGEFELELNGSRFQSLRRGAYAMQATLEGEWLVFSRLGLFIEPGFSRSLDSTSAESHNLFGIAGGISWKLLQDFQHNFHLQVELGGRYRLDPSAATDPGESSLPFTIDLRSALREGRWTFRGSVGAEAGGVAAHVPMRASLGVYAPFGSSDRFGFWGIEADVDGGREHPIVVALNFVPSLIPLGLPFKIGLGVPWAIGVRTTEPTLGLLVRLFFESAREIEYGKEHAIGSAH
jgi:hypothetical protein